MQIEGVITCVGYADFLAYTLPHNRTQFNYLVVVTSPDDFETQRVCEYRNVHCVITDAFHSRGAKFNKGAGINAGLAMLKRSGWLWHLDADIFLPPLTRDLLERANLDPTCLYGADRFMVPSFNSWQQFLRLPLLQQEDSIWVHPHAFPVGVRVASPDYGGYVPIGFSQLWNATSGVRVYPDQHTDAGRSDMLFTKQWPRGKRGLIPEFLVPILQSAATTTQRVEQESAPQAPEMERADEAQPNRDAAA